MPLKTNGTAIRQRRERLALTLTEFAKQAGYALNSVYAIETDRANGGPKFIRKAAEILECQIADITSDVIERKPADTRRPREVA